MEENQEIKHKTRAGSGFLKQLYSTARTTANQTHSHLKNLTTFLVNFVPIDKVVASELQVRTHFDDQEIEGLAKSIAEHGVLQPILVVQDGDQYKVIAGERRLRASKLAGLDRIPARVIQSDDKGTHEIALRENLDRVDLHPLEEGEGYLSLLETKAYTSYESIAQGFLKPKSRIAECIGFTRLPAETKITLLQRGLKQRSLLRKLLQTPPEQHPGVIEKYAAMEESGDLPLDSKEATNKPEAIKQPKIPTVPKPFDFKLDDKGFKIPSFVWKSGEDDSRLLGFIEAMERALPELKQKINS